MCPCRLTVESEVAKKRGNEVQEEAEGYADVCHLLHPGLGGPEKHKTFSGLTLQTHSEAVKAAALTVPARSRWAGQPCGTERRRPWWGWHRHSVNQIHRNTAVINKLSAYTVTQNGRAGGSSMSQIVEIIEPGA